MECNSDGTITLVKELNTDFVIPKKKIPSADMNYQGYIEPQSVNNSYRNVCDYNAQYQEVYNQCPQQYYTQNGNSNYPQQFQQPNRGVKRTINYKEQPKNQEPSTKYKNSFTDLHDLTLPEELLKMLQPLFCKLCSASLNSNLNARMHYASKNHSKKIKKWLIEHSLKTGEPVHKRALIIETPKTAPNVTEAKFFYCEVCDLPLTGRVHAEQHYIGKNHQNVLTGKRPPSGKGYYNDEGKWIRTVEAKADPTGRDGFGQGFILAPAGASASTAPNFDATESNSSMFRCELCNISVTSCPQMQDHLKGQKHLKKSKTATSPMPIVHKNITGDASLQDNVLTEEYLAKFRTPSGNFYCKLCDTNVNSDTQFNAHIQSKKHLRKVNAESTNFK